MTTRQQRRAAERASAKPAAAEYPDALLRCVNILRRFDPLQLELAASVLAAMEETPTAEILEIGRPDSGQRVS